MLRSWIVLSNHDMPRLAHRLPDVDVRKFAQVLQFTLPGCPLIYYGDEIGMAGGDDPDNRATFPWEQATDDNGFLAHTRTVLAMRKRLRALRIGDYRALPSQRRRRALMAAALERPMTAERIKFTVPERRPRRSWTVIPRRQGELRSRPLVVVHLPPSSASRCRRAAVPGLSRRRSAEGLASSRAATRLCRPTRITLLLPDAVWVATLRCARARFASVRLLGRRFRAALLAPRTAVSLDAGASAMPRPQPGGGRARPPLLRPPWCGLFVTLAAILRPTSSH